MKSIFGSITILSQNLSVNNKISEITNIMDISFIKMTTCFTYTLVVILDDISVEMPFKIVYLRMES